MLPRELVEKFLGRPGTASLHIVKTALDCFDRLPIVLTFPRQVIGQDIVECIGGALPAPPSELLELSQPLRLHWRRSHLLKVEVRGAAANTRVMNRWRGACASGNSATSGQAEPSLAEIRQPVLFQDLDDLARWLLWPDEPSLRGEVVKEPDPRKRVRRL